MSTFRSAVKQHFKEYLKRYFGLLRTQTNKNSIKYFLRYLLKPFMQLKWLNICITDLELLMNYCISSYINNCKIISCQKSSS